MKAVTRRQSGTCGQNPRVSPEISCNFCWPLWLEVSSLLSEYKCVVTGHRVDEETDGHGRLFLQFNSIVTIHTHTHTPHTSQTHTSQKHTHTHTPHHTSTHTHTPHTHQSFCSCHLSDRHTDRALHHPHRLPYIHPRRQPPVQRVALTVRLLLFVDVICASVRFVCFALLCLTIRLSFFQSTSNLILSN
jgi:hypothetical protein